MKKFMIFFLFIIFYAGFLVFTQLLFGDDNLVAIKGNVQSNYSLVKTETVKDQHLNFAYLIVRLKGDGRFYTLKADVSGIKDGANLFAGVAHALKKAGEVEIRIRKAELGEVNPKVYQIKADEKDIFNVLKKPANNSRLYIFLLLIILLFCSVYYWLQCLTFPSRKPDRRHKWAFTIG